MKEGGYRLWGISRGVGYLCRVQYLSYIRRVCIWEFFLFSLWKAMVSVLELVQGFLVFCWDLGVGREGSWGWLGRKQRDIFGQVWLVGYNILRFSMCYFKFEDQYFRNLVMGFWGLRSFQELGQEREVGKDLVFWGQSGRYQVGFLIVSFY